MAPPADPLEPEDLARRILFPCGPAAGTMTGTTINAKGCKAVANAV